MINNELAKIVQDAARDQGIKIMELDDMCDELIYPRVSKVWHGVSSAKLCDVEYVLSKLNVKIRYVYEPA